MKRPEVSKVFTPGSATVNPAMYVDRPQHERDLKRAVKGSLHVVLSGESGGGKSWLYKHVAQKEGWKTFYANAGNAVRCGSLGAIMALAVRRSNDREIVEFSQELEAGAKAFGFGGSGKAGRKYAVTPQEALLKAFRTAREKAGNRQAVMVVDNLEAIFSVSCNPEAFCNRGFTAKFLPHRISALWLLRTLN
jgi:hypothetical protein